MVPAGRKYRPDIDGLRALAVVPVVLFHAGIPAFSGGYVGVDIFFVISGYLITGILLKDAEENRFSILGFYDRRIRRIFPALLLVIFSTLIACWFVMLPGEFEALGESAISAILFYSNFYAWWETDYFGPEPFENALLHTWSLAVEEQFYVVWPLVIGLLARNSLRRLILPLTFLMFVVSLVMAIFFMTYSEKTAFYMFPPRAWELFLGALLAIAPQVRIKSRTGKEAASLLGLALIVYAVAAYDAKTAFPGLTAIPPTLGAALLILANQDGDTVVARMLSFRPVVWVGLISYSLYLWHWPVFSIYHLQFGAEISPLAAVGLSILSGVLAWGSWRWVERPFRERRHAATDLRKDQRKVIGWAAASMGAVAAAGLILVAANGFPQRLPPNARSIAPMAVDDYEPTRGCVIGDITIRNIKSECFVDTSQDTTPRTAIWGDSHARAFAIGLDPAFIAAGESLLVLTKPGCIALPGTLPQFFSETTTMRCRNFTDDSLELLATSPSIDTVVLANRWEQLGYDDTVTGKQVEPARWLFDDNTRLRDNDATMAVAKRSLMATAARLNAAGKRLIIMQQVPSFSGSALKCLIRARWSELPEERCEVRRTTLERKRQRITQMLEEVAAANPNVELYDPLPLMCPGGRCVVQTNGAPLYRDEHHLSKFGSSLLSEDIVSRIGVASTVSSASLPVSASES